MRKVWFNGRIVDERNAKLSIYDSSLMFGACIFEMTRSFNKNHFKLREHLERLYRSCKYMHINIPYSIDELEKFCVEIANINEEYMDDNDEHRLLINVTPGLLSIYQNMMPYEYDGVNVIIADFPLKYTVKGMDNYFNKGINAMVTNQKQVSFHVLDPKLKHRNRMHFLLANIEVSTCKIPNTWALLQDENGFITEGTGANFFIIKNNTIISPKDHNILNGISRQYIIDELVPKLRNVWVSKNDITIYDVMNADEAFFTATPFCILPCVSINGVKIGNGQRGYITQDLLDCWSSNVGVDIEEQILMWNKKMDCSIAGASPYEFKRS